MFGKCKPKVLFTVPIHVWEQYPRHSGTDYRRPKAEVIPFPRRANALARLGALSVGAMAAVTGLVVHR